MNNIPTIQNSISMNRFLVLKCLFKVENNIEEINLENLKIGFSFGTFFSEKLNEFVIEFNIKIQSEIKDVFLLEVKTNTIFKTAALIDDDFKKSKFANINAPAIAFPFLRSYIQTICVNSGINPVILPSFNFAKCEDK